MTSEEMAIVKALKVRPLREGELKRITGLSSLWPHVSDLRAVGLLSSTLNHDWPEDDNKLYFLK